MKINNNNIENIFYKKVKLQNNSDQNKLQIFNGKNSWEGTKKCGRSTLSRDIKKDKKGFF